MTAGDTALSSPLDDNLLSLHLLPVLDAGILMASRCGGFGRSRGTRAAGNRYCCVGRAGGSFRLRGCEVWTVFGFAATIPGNREGKGWVGSRPLGLLRRFGETSPSDANGPGSAFEAVK